MNQEQIQDLKDFLGMANYKKGDIIGLVLHCGFSDYYDIDENCHFNVVGDGEIKITCQTVLEEKRHVYRRSRRRIGVSVSCLLGAKTPPREYAPDLVKYPREYGPHPPTKHQIDSMIELCTFLKDYFRLMPNQIMTHAEWAVKDNYFITNAYGLDRWFDPVMGDVHWDWWKEGPIFKALICGYPPPVSTEKTIKLCDAAD